VAGDRSFSVGTASDGNALLGVDTKDPEGDSGESVTLMTLTNRFTDPLTLERVSVVSSGQLSIGRNDLDVSTWSLQPGESAEIDGTVEADGDVSLDSKAVVKGDVDAGGSVSVGQGASIKGDVSEGG
jgi:hypothetical protein